MGQLRHRRMRRRWLHAGAWVLAIAFVGADLLATAATYSRTGAMVSEANARSRGGDSGRDSSGGQRSGGNSNSSNNNSGRSQGNTSSGDSRDSSSGREDRSERTERNDTGERASATATSRADSRSDNRNDRRDDKRDDKSDDKKDDSKGDKKDEKRAARRDDAPAAPNAPPATLAEAFERLMKSSSPPQQPAPASPEKPGATAAKSAPATAVTSKSKTTPAPAPAFQPVDTAGQPYVPNTVLAVKPSPQALQIARDLRFGMPPQRGTGVVRLTPPPGMNAAAALDLLNAQTAAARIPGSSFQFNWIYRVYRQARHGDDHQAQRTQPARQPGSAVPCQGDRCAGRQLIGWHAPLAACSSGLKIGVIDTDVDYDHPAFSRRRLNTGTFIPKGRAPAPNWHGTGVLALLAGDEEGGTPGLVPNAEFYVASVFYRESDGGFATDSESVVDALHWMSKFDVKVVNMSFAGPNDPAVHGWIKSLSALGVAFVAAAGNEGPNAAPSYPAAYPEVIAVTAVNKELRGFAYANRGGHIDIAAPGVDIWTAVPGAREGYYSGTSFAAPYATAVVATLYRAGPRTTKDKLIGLIQTKDLGAPGRDPIFGRGIVVAPPGCGPGPMTARAAPQSGQGAPVIQAAWPSSRPEATAAQPAASPQEPLGFR